MNTGFFTVEILKEMESASDLPMAKEIAFNAVTAQPKARLTNVKKANQVINKATSKTQLLISCGNS